MNTPRLSLMTTLLLLVLGLPSLAMAQNGVQRLVNPTPFHSNAIYWVRIVADGDRIAVSTDHSSLFPEYQYGGIIHTFRFVNEQWVLEDTIHSPALKQQDFFGYHLAMHNNTLVARAFRNSVNDDEMGLFVFQRTGEEWSLEKEFVSIDLPAPTVANSVAIASGTILVGTGDEPGAPVDSGGVAILEQKAGQWIDAGRLPTMGLQANDRFGSALAAAGQWCVVGSSNFGLGEDGAIFIYQFDAGQWLLHQIITAPDSVVNAEFGCAVAMYDDLIVVNDCLVQPNGATYVYRLETATSSWQFEAGLTSDAQVAARTKLAVGENLIVTGNEFHGANPAFSIFRFDGTSWSESYAMQCLTEDCSQQLAPRPETTFAVSDKYIVAGVSQAHSSSRDYIAIVGPIATTPEHDCNGNLLDDAFEIAVGNPDCNSNDIPDECETAGVGDCDGNGICDAFEIANGDVFDCNKDGVIDFACEDFLVDDDGDGAFDECDNCVDLYNPQQRDCDNDGVGDLCAIANGLVEDCNKDGVPDFCQGDYAVDNGIFQVQWIGNNSDYDCLSIQQFRVQPGGEVVNGVEIFWSVGAPRPAMLLLYNDPNNDGDPNDGQLLWKQDIMSATFDDGYVAYPVDDIFVGNTGQYFFVAVESTGHIFPAPQGGSGDEPPGRWIAADTIGDFDPTDLSSLGIASPYYQEGGPWMIRASASPRNACECPADIVSARGFSGDGVVDAHDLMLLLEQWGGCAEPCPPLCPADITGDCAVDVFDLLSLLAQWGPCE